MAGRAVFSAGCARGWRLRVLYVASAIEVGGTSGGAIHVSEVACGLRSLGHEVEVIARPMVRGTKSTRLECGVPVGLSRWRKELALLAYPQVRQAMRKFRP